MKRALFIKAWELFRSFKMSFSQALTEAWKLVKRELLVVAYKKIPSKKQYEKKKAAAKMMWQSIETISYPFRNTLNNDGAFAYYGAGRYSGD